MCSSDLRGKTDDTGCCFTGAGFSCGNSELTADKRRLVMFSIEGKLFGALSRMADLVILNVLFLLCCVPVITTGAAITAMYYVAGKMAENKEGYIFKSFF